MIYKIYCRVIQKLTFVGLHFIKWRQPILIEGKRSTMRVSEILKEKHKRRPLLITDQGIRKLGLMDEMIRALEILDIEYEIFDRTVPNPTVNNIEEACKMYCDNKCDSLIAFGGGSVIDCAKGVGARTARPEMSIEQMRGALKVKKELPMLIAVPTTAGTGSETTIVSVVTDRDNHEKYAVSDVVLAPHYAILDPTLTLGLPKQLTATTGMDALTHAIEAYIGKSNTKKTKENAKKAIVLIYENIILAYLDGRNETARKNMLKASYMAGLAFTRASVGYVHAIAHSLGGRYNVPHGLANAVILPHVLEAYDSSVIGSLSELADLVNVGDRGQSRREKADSFVESIRNLNELMNIPQKISELTEGDIPHLANKASIEANPAYPVPRIFSSTQLEKIYKKVLV